MVIFLCSQVIMYLHQGIIDILLLLVKIPKQPIKHKKFRLNKLQNHYTKTISTNHNTNTIKNWYEYKQKPNTITKQKYQWRYLHYERSYWMPVTSWNYLLGPMYFSSNITNRSVYSNNFELAKLCLDQGYKPDQYTIIYLIKAGYNTMFKICCIEYDVSINTEMINTAARYKNIDIYNMCIQHYIGN